jgi:presenilin-like A22 family membrane protease
MKHDFQVTILLMLLFFSAQILGLVLLNLSIESVEQTEQGTIEVVYTEPVTGRPELEGQDSFTYTIFMILLGTVLLLLLIRFRLFKVWKAWFFLAVWGALSIALGVLLPQTIAVIIAVVLAYLKLYRPNVYIHNITEVFMYAGIAVLIAPLFTVFWMLMLLIVISAYDAFAVWKSKHMITLAKAQANERMFAGLLVPYSSKTQNTSTKIRSAMPKGIKMQKVKSAILGGGDIAFPLLFAGSVMTGLIQSGMPKESALLISMIIPIFSGIALFLLLVKGKKDRFYPAMPFITAGCLIGYGIILLF